MNSAANAAGSLLAALASNWIVVGSEDRAFFSTYGGLHANERVTGVMPIYLLDGTRVANNAADLWDGSIANAINLNELGGITNRNVWTGSTAAVPEPQSLALVLLGLGLGLGLGAAALATRRAPHPGGAFASD